MARPLLVVALIIAGGCSHSTPYLRSPPSPPPAVDDTLAYRLLLVGDTGAPIDNDPVHAAVQAWASVDAARTRIILLGDNIYPNGIRAADHPGHAESTRRLQVQLEAIAGSGASATFVPGNHDWDNSGPDGIGAIARQEEMIRAFARRTGTAIDLLPDGGCPGPVAVDLPHVTVVLLDTEWWLQDDAARQRSQCPTSTEDEILTELDELLAARAGQQVVVVTHHPFRTNGRHGGFRDWRDYFFPLTNFGAWGWIPVPLVYPLASPFIESPQNIGNATNRHMVESLTTVLERHRPLALASGHDHVLQVFDDERAAEVVLVSGAGSVPKITKVGHDVKTAFAYAHHGFMTLDFLENGGVVLRVIETGAEPREVYRRRLRSGADPAR